MDAHAWDARYAARDLLWSAGPNQFVADELIGLRPGRAVDLAAGEGRNALWLARRGWRVSAVDFSAVALDRGRQLENALATGATGPSEDPRVEWVHTDVLRWVPDRPDYDLALLAYLHLPADELDRVLRRAFAALAPGGTLLVVAHDATNLSEGTGGPQEAAVLYTAEDVLAALDGERFHVERAERVARVVQPEEGHRGEPARTAYDALVRVVRTR